MIDKYICASFLIISSILILIAKFLWKISIFVSGGDDAGTVVVFIFAVCLSVIIIPMFLFIIHEIDEILGLSKYLRKKGEDKK